MSHSPHYEYPPDLAESPPTHLQNLRCPVCQMLSLEPVRVEHAVREQDCGLVMCRGCYESWCQKTTGVRHCLYCRGECVVAAGVGPDRLLGRLLGHLPVRCVHCGHNGRVDDMSVHLRLRPPCAVDDATRAFASVSVLPRADAARVPRLDRGRVAPPCVPRSR